ncbi:MAG TPA: hypothetical protein VN228_11185 [Pyrinomonadaceae bacterium]|nr:hypothetical protein [Pyrinomonadaceae bacterium]
MKRLGIFVFVAALTCAGAQGQQRPRSAADGETPGRVASLGQVRKIYVGDMGDDEEAERFRLLIEEALEREGFAVVGTAEDSDAVLTGALSVRDYDDKSEARAFVRLLTPAGARLWGRDFGHRRAVNPFSRKEPTKRRAEEIAEALHRDWARTARATP